MISSSRGLPRSSSSKESNEAVAEAIRQGQTGRIRPAGPDRVGALVLAAASEAFEVVYNKEIDQGPQKTIWAARRVQKLGSRQDRLPNLEPFSPE